ncbi:MAG TPA: hypothetical protein VK066_21785 [Chloroflexota bacterium]|nr:hypothetical protein [Chloroflexota bacterium]
MTLLLEILATELLATAVREAGSYTIRRALAGPAATASPPVAPVQAPATLRLAPDGDPVVRSHTHGRVRLEVPGLRRDAARAAAVERRLQALAGVTRAQANSRTSTVLVHYDPRRTTVAAIRAAAACRTDVPASAEPEPRGRWGRPISIQEGRTNEFRRLSLAV